jgi:DNA-binding CsgD family transcriptional regulator
MTMLTTRPLRPADVPACASLLRAGGARGALLDHVLLARLLAERRLIARVVEEATAAGGCRLRGCGLSALLAPEAAESAARGEIPGLVETALASCRGDSPLLLDRSRAGALCTANRLHMLVLDFGIDSAPDCAVEEVTALLHNAFIQAHSGYGVRSVLAEVRPWELKAEAYRASLLAMGCRPAPPAADGSQVMALHADQIAGQPFHLLQPLFLRRAPRLRLTPALQDVLELACLGFDDGAIAQQLHVSLHTVQKRWRAIYARAAETLPALLRERPRVTADASAVRGAEKRRRLVEYARTHPEELRPWSAGRRHG